MDIFSTIFSSPLTPVTLALATVALTVVSFIRGWILPKGTVMLLIAAEHARSVDFQAAWEAEKQRNDTLMEYLQKLLSFAEAADRVLKSLPANERGENV